EAKLMVIETREQVASNLPFAELRNRGGGFRDRRIRGDREERWQRGSLRRSPGADRHVNRLQSIGFGFESPTSSPIGLFEERGCVGLSGRVVRYEKGCVRLLRLRWLFFLQQTFVRLVANGLDGLIQADDVTHPRQLGRRIARELGRSVAGL